MALSVSRKNIIIAAMAIAFIAVIGRLFYVQIIEDKYRINAENNALKYKINYPARGRILDRNGEILVDNKIIYDIEVVPYDVKPFDTLAFCQIFNLEEEFVKERFEYYRKYRSRIGFGSVTFLKQVPGEMYDKFAEKSYMFPGFDAVIRTAREYPVNSGGNLLGYTSEVDQNFLDSHEGYSMGDFAGKTGMEMAFEDRLKGEKGYEIFLLDAHNRIQEHYENGEYDKEAIGGSDVMTTIDLHLQAYADMVHFPWARYLVSLPSDAYDLALQAKYQRRRWALLARGRVRLRQRDNEAKTALTSNNEYRGRLAVTASLSPAVSTKTQIDAVRTFYLEASHGWMVSQHVTWQQTWLTASAMAALFDTDVYASRIYLYERQMAHEFSSPSFYGEGLRLLIMAGARLGRSITLTARLGYTNYFDRATIGTAMQQIDHSHQTDLDIQLRWKM